MNKYLQVLLIFLAQSLIIASDCGLYGCCPDGKTPAKGFGQAGCPLYVCDMLPFYNTVYDGELRWSYVSDKDYCIYSFFQECGRSENNFATREDCERTCKGGKKEAISIGKYPTADIKLSSVTVTRGETVRVVCEVTGFPLPCIEWEKYNFQKNTRFEDENGTLVIRNIQSEDKGRYMCSGKNYFGIARDRILINVI